MPRYAMVIDQERCIGCHSCAVACKSEWDVPVGFARTKVRQAGTTGTFPSLSTVFYVSQCNHCDRPSCVPACPSGATYQDEQGIVRVNRGLCIGCGACVAACPYGARYVDPQLGKVDKCDFCVGRISKGLGPACVATCPARAKVFGDLEDPSGAVFQYVYRQGAQRTESASVTIGPNVYYAARPEHLELLLASFAPQSPRTIPAARIWAAMLNKFVFLAVGATFLGQAVAFFRQLALGEKQFEE